MKRVCSDLKVKSVSTLFTFMKSRSNSYELYLEGKKKSKEEKRKGVRKRLNLNHGDYTY